MVLETGERPPLEAMECNSGERNLEIRTYATRAALDAALASIDRFCGYRTIGDRWMIVANAGDTAELARSRLGGQVVTLHGCGFPPPAASSSSGAGRCVAVMRSPSPGV